MQLRQIECFLAVARELSFARAAEALHMGPSGVSESIKAFELDLGGRLFTRTSRRVQLTLLGEQLLAEAEPALMDLRAAVESARARGRGTPQLLTIGYLGGGFYGLTAPLIAEMARRRSDVVIRLQEVSYVDQVSDLLRGTLDAAMLRLPVGHPGLERGAVLLSGPRVLCVPTNHRWAEATLVHAEELAEETFLRLPPDAPTEAWRDYHFPLHTPEGRRIADGPVIRTVREGLAAVAGGLGVFMLTKEAQNYYAQPGVAFVPIDVPPVSSAIVYRANDHRAILGDLERAAREVAGAAGSLVPMDQLRVPA